MFGVVDLKKYEAVQVWVLWRSLGKEGRVGRAWG